MTFRLVPPVAGNLTDQPRHAIIRCLYGPQPERMARRLVTDVLAGSGVIADLPDVELAVNELVTNARQHAPGPYELRIYRCRASVKVAVMDSGADHAELAQKLLEAASGGMADGASGRGLQIVTGLFPGSWGIEPASTCTGLTPAKQIWIIVARSAQARPGIASGRGAAMPDRSVAGHRP